jgi:UDP-N-acetylglucosamine acyltransferase
MTLIHSTAIVDPAARLHESVQVGPYSIIGPHVEIGAGTTVASHCVIDGHTTIGRDNRFWPFSSIGCAPQDKKYAGEPTRLEIGDGNTFRESCTVSTGTVQDEGLTRIGHDNWIMAYVHIAHDCRVGSHTIMANVTTLAGHVHIGDWAIIGGLTGVHQFSRVGAHAMAGFQSRIAQDVPPFVMVAGNPCEAHGFNQEGLKRRGFSAERIAVVKQMYRALYRKGLTLEAARAEIEALRGGVPEADGEVDLMLGFLAQATRGIVR